jgi:predicted dehydrogenase
VSFESDPKNSVEICDRPGNYARMNTLENGGDITRRDFIRGGSLATVMSLLGGVELKAAAPRNAEGKELIGPKVPLGVIGLGPWGREILSTLQRIPEAEILAICDTYPPMLRRSANNVPGAKAVEDYRAILDDKSIKAVLIATPTQEHKEMAVAALAAGKHVYCEAPMANTIEDTKAIANAARQAVGQVFQTGLAMRSDPQRNFLLTFIRSGAVGRFLITRAQWHKKQSWRQTSPNAEREKAINWRLAQDISLGLIGEVGIHQVDLFNWYLKALPKAVTGWGGVLCWKDGREVPDTIQAVFEYPEGVQGLYDAMLSNSFDGDYEVFYGVNAAIMQRAAKSWLFKEVDSPLLGWEVYAKKDVFYKETGIALVADATKSVKQVEAEAEEPPYASTILTYALENFVTNAGIVGGAVDDFKETYGSIDKTALAKQISELTLAPAAGWREGLDATVTVIKANEAITHRKRIELQKEWYELAS